MTNWSYTDCGSPEDPLRIESITSSPDPLTPGSEWKLIIKGVAQSEIKDGAYLDVTVKLGLIKLISKRFDLFEVLRGGDFLGWTLTLDTGVGGGSIGKGPVVLTLGKKRTRETPGTKYTVSLRGYTAEEDGLLCIDLKADFMKRVDAR